MKNRTTVDTDIEHEDGGWEFNEEVAENFDDHVRKSIPNYHKIQTDVVTITDWFVQNEQSDTIYDLGCATGETLERLVKYHRGSEMSYVGIDVEEAMLSKARERLDIHDQVQLINQDLSLDPRFPNASIVISLFTLSFIPEEDRQRLLSKIYDELSRGGALIFCEKTRSESSHFQDIWTERYWDFKQSNFDAEQVLGKAKTLRGQLRPLSVSEYYDYLEAAGFESEKIDLFYKWYPWAGFIAKK